MGVIIMDEVINKLDNLYNIIGDTSDLFNETKMFFKDNSDPEAQKIIDSINSFFDEDYFKYKSESEMTLKELKSELEKTNERIKELEAKIEEEEKNLVVYKELEESDEKTKLVAVSESLLEHYKEEKEEILKSKESLESKIAKLTELNKKISNKVAKDKKYNIHHNISIALTQSLGEEDYELKATIISMEDKEISEVDYDDLFEKFATALDKDMSNEKKAKLKGELFPYVTSAKGTREFTKEDTDKVIAIINKYKAEKVIDEKLGSTEEERREVPLKPIEISRKEGHEARKEDHVSRLEPEKHHSVEKPELAEAMSPKTEPAPAMEEAPAPGTAAPAEEMEEEMAAREEITEQTIAVLIANKKLPALELKEYQAICRQVGIDISKDGLNTIIDNEQLNRLLYHRDIREEKLKNKLADKADVVLDQYNSMIERYEQLIEKVKENSISFSPEFLQRLEFLKTQLEMARGRYISSARRMIDRTEIKGRRVDNITRKLSGQYREYERFKSLGNKKKMDKIYKKIEALREKEIILMSKQVKIANKNCAKFLDITQREHLAYQRREEKALAAADKILEYKEEIDSRMTENTAIRDELLSDEFENGFSGRKIRQANRNVRDNNKRIQQLFKMQGKTDKKFQHHEFSELLEEFYNSFTR